MKDISDQEFIESLVGILGSIKEANDTLKTHEGTQTIALTSLVGVLAIIAKEIRLLRQCTEVQVDCLEGENMSAHSLVATLSTICPSCGGTNLECKDGVHFCNECGHHWNVQDYIKNGTVLPSLQVKEDSPIYVHWSMWIKGWIFGWLLSIGLIYFGSVLHQNWMVALGGIYFICTPWISHKNRWHKADH